MNRVEIPLSKTKIVLLLVGALIFVLLGASFLIFPDVFITNYRKLSPAVIRVIGAASVLFFGAAAIFSFRKIGDKRPGLIIDDQGIFDNTNGTSIGVISWKDITKIETMEIASTKLLLVHVSNPEDYIDKVSGLRKVAMRENYKRYGTPLSITSNTLKCNFSTLQQLLSDRLMAK